MAASADSPARRGPSRRVSSRTKARKAALDILFEADLRGLPPLDVLAAHEDGEPALRPYTTTLVREVVARRGEIDARIAAQLSGDWSLERMPRVDRNLARIAVAELMAGEVDASVAIAEAVGLAGELSTDESPAFLNGVLGGVARSEARAGGVSQGGVGRGESERREAGQNESGRGEVGHGEVGHAEVNDGEISRPE